MRFEVQALAQRSHKVGPVVTSLPSTECLKLRLHQTGENRPGLRRAMGADNIEFRDFNPRIRVFYTD